MEKNSPGGWKEGRKRKVAMLLAYCGASYQGMQRNPGAITIEGELEQALFRADAIAQCNFGDMRKVDWMRAARTDKGVSAIGQIVSARLVIDPPGLVERVNQHLPKDIRVFGYTRVTSNFNAKQMCDKRRYEYLVPVFAFDPHAHHDRETMNMWNERKENVRLQRIEKRKALEQKAAGSEAGAANAKDSTSGMICPFLLLKQMIFLIFFVFVVFETNES
jgi:tRNA pseudouridine(38-40) synthase